MGRNLPPGCSVSDLPGNREPIEPREEECAVCGVTVRIPPSRRSEVEGPFFCDSHDIEDLRKKAENEAREEPDPVQGAFERGPGF